MNPKYTHSAREHRTANGWVEPLVAYIKSDAFTDEDRPLTYQGAIDRFDLRTERLPRHHNAEVYLNRWAPERTPLGVGELAPGTISAPHGNAHVAAHLAPQYARSDRIGTQLLKTAWQPSAAGRT